MASLAAPGTLRQRISDWIYRPRTPETPPITLGQRRVYIIPTKQGIGYVVVLLLVLIASINYTLSLGYVVTFFLASIGWVALHATHRNLARLELRPGRSDPVFVGESVHFQVTLRAAERVRYAIGLCFASRELKGGDVYIDVPAGEVASAELQRRAERRGRLSPGRLEVFTQYPLGLFHAWSYFDFGQVAIVYPRPDASGGPLPVALGVAADEGTIAPGDDEFAGLRDYQAGDNLRKVAWKAWARGQGLLTKQFHGYQSGDLWLDFSQVSGIDVESRLSRLCHWVLEADQKGLRFGLRLPGVTIEPATGDGHRVRCLEALALA